MFWSVKVHTESADYNVKLQADSREAAKAAATQVIVESKPGVKQGPVYTYATLDTENNNAKQNK